MHLLQLRKVFVLIAGLMILIGCTDDPFDSDISDIEVQLKIERFDRELRNFTPGKADSLIPYFRSKYDYFFEVFNRQILQIGSADSPAYAENLHHFVLYNESEGIFNAADEIFGNFSEENSKLTDLYKRHKFHFPNDTLPVTVLFLSGFNHSVVTVESYLGIALDKYLGYQSPYYGGADLYLRKRMDKAYLFTDVAAALAEADFPPPFDSPNMFEKMIYEGKKQYFINSMLPETHDTLRWFYTAKQLDWAERNEANVWNHLQEDQLLFSDDRMKIRQYTEIAPFTIPLSDASAPRAAVFVGYKIVFYYMKNHPHVSLEELMKEDDYQNILAGANYHP